jgi:glycosyltransferase involved in cell wall biosynthesis
MRAMNLANELIKHGHEVLLWTSNFDHNLKKHRYQGSCVVDVSDLLTIKFVESRGYRKHIGVGRIIDHVQLGWNLRKMLCNELAPDAAFIGYPPIEPAWVMSRWLHRRKTPFILDIKDAWPEVLVNAFPEVLKPSARFVFYPYKIMMEDLLRKATGISSVAITFLEWCLRQAKRPANLNDIVVPLTSPETQYPKSEYDQARNFWDSLGVTTDNPKRVYFVGTLNYVFDFDPVIFATKNTDIQFVIAGDGPQRDELIQKSKNISNIIFPGWVSSVQAKVLAERSYFALAPLKSRDDFEMSIPNKFIDAFRYGKPILTSLKGTSGNLVTEFGAGVIYSDEKVNNLSDKLSELAANPQEISKMSAASRNLYEAKFDFNRVYSDLVQHLERMVRGQLNNGQS